MMYFIVKILLTPLALIADFLVIILAFFTWDIEFIYQDDNICLLWTKNKTK